VKIVQNKIVQNKIVQNKIAILNQPASQDSLVGAVTWLQAGVPRIVMQSAADARDSAPLHGACTYFGYRTEG